MHLRNLYAAALLTSLISGLSAQIPDFKPPTPLLGAAMQNNTQAVGKLLAEGGNPNETLFIGWSVLSIAAIHSNPAMAKLLLDHGAHINHVDQSGNSALINAIGADVPSLDLINELLKRGADPNLKNKYGETALTWAIRRGNMEVVERLKSAGVTGDAAIRAAAQSAIAVLQKSGPQFVKVSGCTSCHHQSLPQMLNGVARARGFKIDEEISAQQVKSVLAMIRPVREKMQNGSMVPPNPGISIGYTLVGLESENYPSDENTDAMVASILRTQTPSGNFAIIPARPPMEASGVTSTALSVRALRHYGKDIDANVAKAREWLAHAKAVTNEDKAMRLLGLAWSGAPKTLIHHAAEDLMKQQRSDGGWAQLPGMETDAYATGQALTALQMTGTADVDGRIYQHGVAYLLRTQLADGSWLVRSRSNPVQQFKESGFPHGRDQWISAAATGWAGLALTLSQPVTSSIMPTESQ